MTAKSFIRLRICRYCWCKRQVGGELRPSNALDGHASPPPHSRASRPRGRGRAPCLAALPPGLPTDTRLRRHRGPPRGRRHAGGPRGRPHLLRPPARHRHARDAPARHAGGMRRSAGIGPDERAGAAGRPHPAGERPHAGPRGPLRAGDPDQDSPEDGIALCLSGGGYRAMLFHTGALWRLNELGYLNRLARISSVSGGSIAAGVLALAWKDLEFDAGGVSQKFRELVAEKLVDLAGHTIDVGSVIEGVVMPGQSISERVAHDYRKLLYGHATLQDLPPDPAPTFVLNSTNLQTGVLWRFSRSYMADYQVGRVDNPDFPLADAVAASSAFPPILSPSIHDVSGYEFVAGSGQDPALGVPPYTTRLVLSDGGVYDNLGLETAWKRC